MNPRILLVLACAAALLIGLTMWLHVDSGAKRPVDVELNSKSESSAHTVDDLSTPATTHTPVASRAPVVKEDVAPKADADLEKKLASFAGRNVIEGTITSAKDGQPVPMAAITTSVTGLGGYQFAEYRADSIGHFVIKDPASGRWKLTVSARGYANVERVVVFEGLDPVTANFVLTPVTEKPKLLVRLRSTSGQPLLSTLDTPYLEVAKTLRPVIVTKCPPRRADLPAGTSVLPIRATAVTRPVSDDWFEVTLDSKASACCCLMLGNHVLDVAPFDENTTSVALVASRDDLLGWLGSVRVTVLDDVSGEPITAIIEAHPETGETRRADTDARGYVQVDRLMQGDAIVHVFASLRAPVTRKVAVRGGESVDLGVIRMVKTVDISGWVERREGDLAPVNVYAYRIDGDEMRIDDLSTIVLSDSAFIFRGAPPGQYLLSLTGGTRPSLKAVQEGKVIGWAFADARFGAVTGVHIR